MENLKPKIVGAIKHCVFGACNSDSRPGRAGYKLGMRFIPFPKPCLAIRKMGINDKHVRNSHLKDCPTCKNCDNWVKMCKRLDQKFCSIANITKDTYICQEHFVDIDSKPLPLPMPALKIEKLKMDRKRKPLSEMYRPNKIQKMELTNNFMFDIQEQITGATISTNIEDAATSTNVEDAATSTEMSTRSVSTQTSFCFTEEQNLKAEIKSLKKVITTLHRDMEKVAKNNIKEEKMMNKFENKIKNDDKMCKFYTGFVFPQIVMLLNVVSCENISYWGCKSNSQMKERKKYTYLQELILTLVRLRTGLLVRDLSYRFEISTGFVTKIFTTWIQLTFNKFNSLRPLMFPSRQKINETLPKSFSKLKNIRVIIDCAEIFCESPSNFEHQGNLYSHYKAHTTFKLLIGCTPNGAVSFVSELFEGSISDREIVEKSKLMDLLDDQDMILADRGFTINDLAAKNNINLNIPAFLKGRDKLTADEEIQTKLIAKQRIYVEHVVGRIKHYRLLKKIVPLSMRGILSQTVYVCACLLNFQEPLVQ